jgi:hypothetical protein
VQVDSVTIFLFIFFCFSINLIFLHLIWSQIWKADYLGKKNLETVAVSTGMNYGMICLGRECLGDPFSYHSSSCLTTLNRILEKSGNLGCRHSMPQHARHANRGTFPSMDLG